MKRIAFLTTFAIFLLITSCKPARDNSGLSPEEIKALDQVEARLDRGDELVEWSFYDGDVPLSLAAEEFRSLRDAVNKAKLDYQSCQTRGIKAGMDQATAKLEACQQLSAEAQANATPTKALMVMATIERRGSLRYGLVALFNHETSALETWIPVTTPVRNNVLMFVNATDGTLAENGLMVPSDEATFLNAIKNPVERFVVECNPL